MKYNTGRLFVYGISSADYNSTYPAFRLQNVSLKNDSTCSPTEINFNGNGGTCNIPSVYGATGSGFFYPTPSGSRTGYTLNTNGWGTSSGATSVASGTSPGSTRDLTGTAINLYLVWSANTYYVAYNANKPSAATGSVTGLPSTQTCKYDTAFYLGSAPSLNGYTFGGWYNEAGCTTLVGAAGASKSNLTTSGTRTLYAKWTVNSYSLTITGGGNVSSISAKVKTNGAVTNRAGTTLSSGSAIYKDEVITATFTAKTGYHFGSSNATSQTTKDYTVATNNVTISYSDVTPSANTHTITLNGNGGTPSTGSFTHTYGTSQSLTSYTASWTGHTFIGWFTEASGGSQVTSVPSELNESKTYYAHYNAHTYTINYDVNFSDTNLSKITGSTASSSHTYDVAQNLTANGYDLTGQRFTGWNTQSGGGGTSYTNQQSVTNLTSTDKGSVTLYAQWELATYNLLGPIPSSPYIKGSSATWYRESDIEIFTIVDEYLYYRPKAGATPITSATWGDKVFYYYEANVGCYCKPYLGYDVSEDIKNYKSNYRMGYITLNQKTMDYFTQASANFEVNHIEGNRYFSYSFETQMFFSAESLAASNAEILKGTICESCDIKGITTDLTALGSNWTSASTIYSALDEWEKVWLNGTLTSSTSTINDYKSAYAYILTKYPTTCGNNDFMHLFSNSNEVNNVFQTNEKRDLTILFITIGGCSLTILLVFVIRSKKKSLDK